MEQKSMIFLWEPIKVITLANGLSLSYESADVLRFASAAGRYTDQYNISDNVSNDLKNYQTAELIQSR